MNSGVGFIAGKAVMDNINNKAENIRNQAESGGLDASYYRMKTLLLETEELAKTWKERSIRAETSRDAWKLVLKGVVMDDKYPLISKDFVNKEYHNLYDDEVKRNLKAMKVKDRV